MKKISIKIISLFLLSLIMVVVSSCYTEDEEDTKEIIIGFPSAGSNWAGGELAIADYNRYFNEYLEPLGYKVTLTAFANAGPGINDALASKEIDFAIYADIPGIISKSNGVDTKLILVTSRHGSSEIVVPNESDIMTVADLKGKKIGYSRGTTTHSFLLKTLESVGLTESDVELVNITATESSSALLTGAIDANCSVLMVTQSLVENNNARVIISGNDDVEYASTSVLIGRSDFARENEEATVQIIRALNKAKDFIVENPDEFYKISSENSSVSVEGVKVISGDRDKSFPSIPNNLEKEQLDYIEETKMFLFNNQLIANNFDINEWVDSSYLEKAIEVN